MRDKQEDKNVLFFIVLLILTLFFCLFIFDCAPGPGKLLFQSELVDIQMVGINWDLTFKNGYRILIPARNREVKIGSEYKVYRNVLDMIILEEVGGNK